MVCGTRSEYQRLCTHSLTHKRLSRPKFTAVKANLQLGKVDLNKNGDYNPASLARTLNTAQNNEVIVSSYLHLVCECSDVEM